MKTKILLLFSAILFSMSLQAASSIDIINPPASVEGNTNVDITFNYTLAVPGYAYIRFKNGPDTANNLTYVSKLLPAGSGTETLSLPIPRSFNGVTLPLGKSYNYQAQLFDHNNGWAGLDTKDYNGVTLTAAANFISLTTYPTTVNVNGSVDVTFDYATNKTAPVYAFIRLHNTASGAQVATTSAIELTAASGSKTANLVIPSIALGSGYEYRVLLFHPTNWSAAFASDKVTGITVAAYVPPANSITLVTPPTTVAAGSDVDITLNYTTNVANAHIFIRFRDGSNLTDVNKIVTAGSGTLILPLPIPASALGAGYSYQAQIFNIDNGYSNVVTENITGITVSSVPAKTISIVTPSKEVLINSTVNVNLSYTKDVTEAIALVRFLDASGTSVSQTLDYVTANSANLTFSLPTPTVAGMYSYRAELWSSDFATLYYKKTYSGVEAKTTLGVNDFKDNSKNLSIYPNPCSDSFTYTLDNNFSNSTRVELFSANGKKIISQENNEGPSSNTGTVNTNQLNKGMYIVRITSGNLQATKKLIKN